MSEPTAYQIVMEIGHRLAAIDGTGAYHTDAGQRLYRGRMLFDPQHDSFPLLTVQGLEAKETTNDGGYRYTEEQTVVVDGHTRIDPDHPQDALHDLLADIKRGMNPSTPLPGALRVRYQGWEIFDAEIDSYIGSVRVTYTVAYVEAYGQP